MYTEVCVEVCEFVYKTTTTAVSRRELMYIWKVICSNK